MRAIAAASCIAAVLALVPRPAVAERVLYVRGTAEGAVVVVPGHLATATEIRRPRPDMVIVVLSGAALPTQTFHPPAWWVESVRVLGPEILGADETRVVLDLASSATEATILDRGTDTEVVIGGLAPWFAPPAAPPPPAARATARLPPALPPEPAAPPRAAPPLPLPEPEAQRAARSRAEAPPAPRERPEPGVAVRPESPAPRAPPVPRATPPAASALAAPAGMVVVPAGDFAMGTPFGLGFADEAPEHRVWLPTFFIDEREVTVAELQRSPVGLPRQPEWNWGSDQPVVGVTWHEAAEYCRWAGKRLPTEAEWEKAARGSDGRRFPWGSRWNVARANSGEDGDGHDHAAPVGSFPEGASPFGALDMSGNAWEWTADWYGADWYAESPAQSPTGPARGTYRVTRGGSFDGESSFNVRAAVRQPLKASARRDNVGFRCAAD